nr:hypothetical protein [Candidatus Sigynarchaeum springense]
MSETKVIGITAVVSAGLATLLLAGMLGFLLSYHLIPYHHNYSFTVYSDDYHSIDATFQTGEQWVVSYSSSYSIAAYLLDEYCYQDYLYYGHVSNYIASRSGSSGSFEYTVSSGGQYHVVFYSSYYAASVSVTTTEYHFS